MAMNTGFCCKMGKINESERHVVVIVFLLYVRDQNDLTDTK